MPTSFHARYLAGEEDAVWQQLRSLGARVREPELRSDVEAVVGEALVRARRNVITIIERLGEQGYQFGDPHEPGGASRPLSGPDAQTPEMVAWLEARFGPLPLTARAWVEIVGDVSLLGSHPEWPEELVSDPLVVEFELKSWSSVTGRDHAREYFEGEHQAWSDEGEDEPFVLPVAPDALHKANFSGGRPYGFVVPAETADGAFRFDDGQLMPFIDYLRLTFRWGGFPGLASRKHSAAVAASVRTLATGLLML